MTRDRFKFISKHIAITSPAEIEENDRNRERPDPLGRIRWLIDNLKCRSADETVFDLCISLRGKGHIVAFDRFYSSIPLVDHSTTSVSMPLERWIKVKQISRFSLKAIWEKTNSSAESEAKVPVKQYLCGMTPKPSESFLTITARIWLRCRGSRKTASTRWKVVRKPLSITESTWEA